MVTIVRRIIIILIAVVVVTTVMIGVVQSTDHELFPVRNVSLAAMQGSAREVMFFYCPM
jgi:hypothetical protein